MVKQFDTAARRNAGVVPNPVDVEFVWGEFEMVAHPPTNGQLAQFMAGQAGGTGVRAAAERLRAVFNFLAAVLDQPDYDIIDSDLHEGVDVDLVIEVVEYLVEEWSARPTSSSSALPASRRTTGKRSTATRRGAASTSGV